MSGIWWAQRAPGDPEQPTIVKSHRELCAFVLAHPEGVDIPMEERYLSDAELNELERRAGDERAVIPKDPVPQRARIRSYPWNDGKGCPRMGSEDAREVASYIEHCRTIAGMMEPGGSISAAGDQHGLIAVFLKAGV